MEERPLLKLPKGMPPRHTKTDADSLTLTPDEKHLYHAPSRGHRSYRVSAAALADPAQTDAQGYIYLTDYRHDAVKRRSPSGQYETLVPRPGLIRSDSIAFGPDGYMYFTADPFNRQAKYHDGKDLCVRPIPLLRADVGSQPITLK